MPKRPGPGRTRFITEEMINQIVKMRDEGKKWAEIGKELDIGTSTACIYYSRKKSGGSP